ncbi:cytochrome P450 [Guyanagaster necrorhizus]|uniref:Cytochrome P450 n=1 Tax=Guyanagaster necrorhizus TaxID=856835 RepID=A0A9P8ASP0_9AGAR|nr:cytochrome P450 [Guyanagaster necrorhizus MCA 3950]KAG7446121.1 cytochrome P450 [Guyanagaster necrorhizus MCA 3950]
MLGQLEFLAGLVLLGLTLALSSTILFRGAQQLPPGPPPKTISGNIHQMPRVAPWTTFAEWSKQYGSAIIHYRFFGRHFIVLNSVEAALALLEHRSNIYSDRPVVWMYNELAGRGMTVFSVSSQHPHHKIYRRLLQSGLNPRAVQGYQGILERELHILLEGLLNTPENYVKHLRRNAGAVVLDLAYGWPVTSDDDYFVSLMEEAFALHKQVVQPGRWLVEVMPFLRFVPSWMPGAHFKRFAFSVRARMKAIDQEPLKWTKEQMASGNAKDSFTSQHLQPQDGHYVDNNEERMIAWCSSALYAGGADTTVSIMLSFIALMIQYPDVQKKAQNEIDSVLDDHRLPNLDDQSSLPYVSALFKEILRYSPAARLGLPHRVIQEDTYNGYRIPQSSTVMANIWAICRDPSVYTNPDIFDPNRFLTRNEMDPRKLAFGFGRRVCPGAGFAETSVILNIANILACFNILKPVDVNTGAEYCPEISYTTGVTSHPSPFQCRIVPRPRSSVHLHGV